MLFGPERLDILRHAFCRQISQLLSCVREGINVLPKVQEKA